MQLLAHYGSAPTFPTPGRVVRFHSQYFQKLQAMGSEFAIHGYDHIDFHSLTQAEARSQFEQARAAYDKAGITYHGFRCPYLSYSDRLLDTLPEGMVNYSSNTAVDWGLDNLGDGEPRSAMFTNLEEFYAGQPAAVALAVPSMYEKLVEIPVTLPDDLQIYDGLQAGRQGLAQAWLKILHATYQRGEMFTLLFHPELFYDCALAFERLLVETRSLRPGIWVARLCDISAWWYEKAPFTVDTTTHNDSLHLDFACSERATILVRNIETNAPTEQWYGNYRVLKARACTVPAAPRPFIAVMPDVPAATRTMLHEQGYIIEMVSDGSNHAVCIDNALVERLGNPVALLKCIESQQTPLVRYWRWPDGYRSVLSFSGDLDALSLVDYAVRLWRF
ncbi:MAG: polysaccharide deacetylase family protein [Chloroflexaceae bacterium]|nr:polysaccharide deacetylase family protein [Chloroflexaceae bacterium]NJO05063.1 polysaccharide deacetylase family protein [Chloroflexaceae bacterium]